MTSTLELYRRIGNATAKEKRQPIEETEQKRPLYIMVYHKNGWKLKATSVKLGHFKNINGTQGRPSYAIKFEDGETKYYPREDIVGIIPIWKEGHNTIDN